MNDDRSDGTVPDSEAETIQPDKELGWQMPKPKFQQTSGYLPQGYLEKAGLEGGSVGGGAAVAPAVEAPQAEPPAAGVEVEPQPDFSEQIHETDPQTGASVVPAKQRSTGVRVVMVVLGLLGMIVFIALFLGVIWYLFLRPADGGSPF